MELLNCHTEYLPEILRRAVLSRYERKELLTLCKIKEDMVEKVGQRGVQVPLRSVLQKIRFKYEKVDDIKCLLERNDIITAIGYTLTFIQYFLNFYLCCS